MGQGIKFPQEYGQFREAVIRGDISVGEEISKEMNRIDALLEDPNKDASDETVRRFMAFCERELQEDLSTEVQCFGGDMVVVDGHSHEVADRIPVAQMRVEQSNDRIENIIEVTLTRPQVRELHEALGKLL